MQHSERLLYELHRLYQLTDLYAVLKKHCGQPHNCAPANKAIFEELYCPLYENILFISVMQIFIDALTKTTF